MRGSEVFKVGASAVKGGALTGLAATGAGLTTVNTTAMFGLVTTGAVVSAPLVGAFVAGGAVAFGTATAASILVQKGLQRREINRLQKQQRVSPCSLSTRRAPLAREGRGISGKGRG